MTTGKFISIEGGEGAGKSTALRFINEYLSQANIDAVWTREPGGTPIAEQIRQVLLQKSASEPMSPQTELLLMFAGRAQNLQHCIVPALNAGKWVISDRFVDASYAYQGGGRGLTEHEIASLDQWVVGQWYPDLTLLLDIPPAIGLERAANRGMEKDRIEEEQIDFFSRVRQTYLDRAARDARRIKIIDASQPLAAVEQQLREALDQFIRENA